MSNKPIREMTSDELREEYLYWDTKIRAATWWGAALGAAAAFRKDVAQELRRRNEELP